MFSFKAAWICGIAWKENQPPAVVVDCVRSAFIKPFRRLLRIFICCEIITGNNTFGSLLKGIRDEQRFGNYWKIY